jgi:SagB-type dehydrogenase family enzyme
MCNDYYRKIVPSAGARYPVEIHLISFNVTNIENGIYHYNDNDNTLEMTVKGNFNDEAYRNCRFQEMVRECGCLICICLDFNRTISKYGERGYRYALLDAGHVAQNLYLTCTYENLGIAGIGGFYDKKIKKLLKLPKEEDPIYLFSIGNKEGGM